MGSPYRFEVQQNKWKSPTGACAVVLSCSFYAGSRASPPSSTLHNWWYNIKFKWRFRPSLRLPNIRTRKVSQISEHVGLCLIKIQPPFIEVKSQTKKVPKGIISKINYYLNLLIKTTKDNTPLIWTLKPSMPCSKWHPDGRLIPVPSPPGAIWTLINHNIIGWACCNCFVEAIDLFFKYFWTFWYLPWSCHVV